MECRTLEWKFIRLVHFYLIQVKFTLFDVPFNLSDVISKFLITANLFSCDALHIPLFVQSVLKYSTGKAKCGRESSCKRQNHQIRSGRVGLQEGISFGGYRMVYILSDMFLFPVTYVRLKCHFQKKPDAYIQQSDWPRPPWAYLLCLK
jgi:hypothetical protein